MGEQLYLFEIFIDNIFFEECVIDVPAKKQIVISIKLGNIVTLEIRSDTLPHTGEGAIKRHVEFRSGRSYLCSLSTKDLMETVQKHPLEITVGVRGDLKPIGSSSAPWDDSIQEMVVASDDPTAFVTPVAIFDNFCLLDNGVIKGNVQMLFRVSCFGKSIQTQYEVLQDSGNKQFIFKSPNVATTFVCSKYGAGTSSDFIPVGPVFNASTLRTEIYDKTANVKSASWTALMESFTSYGPRFSIQSECLFPEYLNITPPIKDSPMTFDIMSIRARPEEEKFIDFLTGRKAGEASGSISFEGVDEDGREAILFYTDDDQQTMSGRKPMGQITRACQCPKTPTFCKHVFSAIERYEKTHPDLMIHGKKVDYDKLLKHRRYSDNDNFDPLLRLRGGNDENIEPYVMKKRKGCYNPSCRMGVKLRSVGLSQLTEIRNMNNTAMDEDFCADFFCPESNRRNIALQVTFSEESTKWQLSCRDKYCPAAHKLKKFGLGPLAKGKCLGTLYGPVKPPIQYGLSQTYGTFDTYGPYGIFNQTSTPFLPRNEDICEHRLVLRLRGGCSKITIPTVNVSDQTKNMTFPDPYHQLFVSNASFYFLTFSHHLSKFRLRGGGTTKEYTKTGVPSQTKSPLIECQEVMEQFDKILEDYRKALCSDKENVEQFMPPSLAPNCGHPRCSYLPQHILPPIHWDCPDPLPAGICKNPHCPYLPQELKRIGRILEDESKKRTCRLNNYLLRSIQDYPNVKKGGEENVEEGQLEITSGKRPSAYDMAPCTVQTCQFTGGNFACKDCSPPSNLLIQCCQNKYKNKGCPNPRCLTNLLRNNQMKTQNGETGEEGALEIIKGDRPSKYDMVPCTKQSCLASGGQLICEDCANAIDKSKRSQGKGENALGCTNSKCLFYHGVQGGLKKTTAQFGVAEGDLEKTRGDRPPTYDMAPCTIHTCTNTGGQLICEDCDITKRPKGPYCRKDRGCTNRKCLFYRGTNATSEAGDHRITQFGVEEGALETTTGDRPSVYDMAPCTMESCLASGGQLICEDCTNAIEKNKRSCGKCGDALGCANPKCLFYRGIRDGHKKTSAPFGVEEGELEETRGDRSSTYDLAPCTVQTCSYKGGQLLCKDCDNTKYPREKSVRPNCTNPKCLLYYGAKMISAAGDHTITQFGVEEGALETTTGDRPSTYDMTPCTKETCLRTGGRLICEECAIDQWKREQCPNPNCPFARKILIEACSNPDCPFAEKTSSEICLNPDCPLKRLPISEGCSNPDCPFNKHPSEESGKKHDSSYSTEICATTTPVPEGFFVCDATSECKCDNPNCPAHKEPCSNPDCPFKIKNAEICANPECPYKKKHLTKDKFTCGSPNRSICGDATCPFQDKGEKENGSEDLKVIKSSQDQKPTVQETAIEGIEEGAIEVTSGDRPSKYDMVPCTLKTCRYMGGKLKCVDCATLTEGRKRGPCPKICTGDIRCPLVKTPIRKKVISPEAIKRCLKRERNKFMYHFGDTYPGINLGHTNCVVMPFNVPAKMGWLWNIHTPCMSLRQRRGWRPGALGKKILEAIQAHRRAQNLAPLEEGKRKRKKKFGGVESETEIIRPKPTLQIKRKEGVYYITMNPLKDPRTLVTNENPYMECTPMQFKIVKNKPNNEFKSCVCNDQGVVYEPDSTSSSDSELDIEFTPPAGLIRPEKFIKTKNVIHIDTQYNQFDFTPSGKEKPESKDKEKNKPREKSKDKEKIKDKEKDKNKTKDKKKTK